MRIHNVYEDANGESHFRDIEVDWVEETPTGKLSKRLPATGIVFRETTTDYENSWYRAPRRQYVISLAGGITITASDGETRHIGAGVIVLVEDTTGKGHITKSSGDKPRHTQQRPHAAGLCTGLQPVFRVVRGSRAIAHGHSAVRCCSMGKGTSGEARPRA